MHHDAYPHGFRQRIAQVFRWVLGGAQTRDQSRQRARYHADGHLWGQHDPDASQQGARQAREAFDRQQRQQGGGRYGR